MAQQHRLGRGNTTVSGEKGLTVITFHWTKIVQFTDKTITLDSGGWRTATTKTRMNQASIQFGLGYQVFQANSAWFVSFKGKTLDFSDNMRLKR
jgi:hypothetical protein